VIKLAVIGCGQWGPNHVRTFNTLPGSRVDAVADPDKARLEHMGDTYPGLLRCEQDYRLILDDSAIDAIVIATPVSTHYDIVRESLLAGKHVLCEKPLCSKSEQGEELIKLARVNGRLLMVGHVFLFNPGIIKLKELVDSGDLGILRYLAASRTNLGPIRSDINAAYDLCSHDISIFNWLLGSEPKVVSATGASFVQSGIEDVVFVSMKYPGNVLASIHASWLDPKKVRQITAVGSRKMATWDDLQTNGPIAIYDKGVETIQDPDNYGEFLRLSMWEGDVHLPKVSVDEPLKVQASEFLKSLQDGRAERADGAFGLGVVKVLEAITASTQEGGCPVRVDPAQVTL
jgi:predicted dehydrogenase